MTVDRPNILCVDDEPAILEGLTLTLHRKYEVSTATSGEAALAHLRQDGSTKVIVSDMRMPVMDGVTFLRGARTVVPDATRVLLTGHADLQSAIGAVNEGQIFRFLTKPCAPPLVMAAIDAAVEQNRLITAERVLVEQTLHGCISALTDVLAVTNPAAFGSAIRLRQTVSDLADGLSMSERWQVEIAAMLSRIGSIAVPPETMERLQNDEPLSDVDRQLVARIPALAERFLGSIPRLESVRGILATSVRPHRAQRDRTTDADSVVIDRGADLLRVASDFDALTSSGMTAARAIEVMQGRSNRYADEVLDALAGREGAAGKRRKTREVALNDLRAGMMLAEDVRLTSGMLLIARGYEVTERFLERARNMKRSSVRAPIRIVA
jgi:CheY-like chemotaxis protein